MEDIEIARKAELKNISEIAADVGIKEEELELYGKYKAKIENEMLLERLKEKEWGVPLRYSSLRIWCC